ncbi:translation initiation factor eIF-2B epsilon subunit, GEF [Batrachochytrium dendrobatidis]|nr:translation initiation factor eIF-2B epsilon subunit, GEF [Batrachochytrium dendrobatidis]KAK5671610.1 translation initiation factor eIF-2B epsilon subunit, GEF [Batrachochytrium dendrobatidis]
MAPTKSAASAKGLAPDDILQAVVVADSFNKRFRPLTLNTPRCLMPLANMPMIEYTLESLAISNIQEIFIVCCSHADQIKSYIKHSRWAKSVTPSVTMIVSQELRSMGDALRDLDAKQVLQSDFVLVSADTVSNIDLIEAINEHKQRRIKDKNAIMTMVLKQASPHHPTRAMGEEELFVIDPKSAECVHYETFGKFPVKRKIKLNPSLFKAHSELSVRNDLIDPQIDICSIEVLALFTENFDYQDIRKDFLKGILESDLLGKTIFCHLSSTGYAARVSTPQMYHSVSHDIMSRWSYPHVPDNCPTHHQMYRHSRPYIYKAVDVSLSRSAQLKEKVIIGTGSSVGEKTIIKGTVIGKGCKIGENVRLEDVYVFDNVIIGDNCQAEKCILACGVELKSGVVLERGCVIGTNVILGPDVIIPSRSKISVEKEDDFGISDNESPSVAASDTEASHENDDDHDDITMHLGLESRGFFYMNEDNEDEDMDCRNIEAGYLDSGCGKDTAADYEPESAIETDLDCAIDESEDDNDWENEVAMTLERAFSDDHTVDIAALELNTLKMAMDITFQNLRETVIPAILARIDLTRPVPSSKETISRWGPLVGKFTHSNADQLNVLHIISVYAKDTLPFQKAFVFVLRFFYDMDVLSEDMILKWHKGLSMGLDGMTNIKSLALPFVAWLEEAEEDDEESSDEE